MQTFIYHDNARWYQRQNCWNEFSQQALWCAILSDHLFWLKFNLEKKIKNERIAVASTSCGYVIRKTGAFISKKFPPHIYCIYLCFLITFFLLSHEADGKLSGGRGGVSLVMMECTVAFCTFPPSTSHLRWLKRPNDEYLGVNPPPLLLSVSSAQQMFSLWPTQKASVFVTRLVHSSKVRGHAGLRAKLSLQV